MPVDVRLVGALRAQLERRDRALSRGARRVGWKLGVGDAERIGTGPVLGHLTTATLLEPGAVFDAAGATALHADAELLVELTRTVGPDDDLDGALRYGVALELVDLAGADQRPELIVAANVFHRAVVLGAATAHAPPTGTGQIVIGGAARASGAIEDVRSRLRAAGEILAAVGESLEAGDRVITGAIAQAPVRAGEDVVADLGTLGTVSAQVR